MKRAILIVIFICSFLQVNAQVELTEELIQEYIEEILNDLDEEQVDNVEFFIQMLEEFSKKPLHLNRDDLSILAQMGIVSNDQLAALDHHIETYGKLLAIYELQTIPGWNLATIRRMQPFVKVNRELDELFIKPRDFLKASTLYFRSYLSRRFPEPRGFESPADTVAPAYEGDPFRHYVRLRAQYQYRFVAGITVEKDEGEALFSGSNDTYDYTSFHAYAQSVNKFIHLIALGDYKINMGQGLILHNGFGGNKSAYVTQIKKGGKLFRPHPSTSEINFFRGVGAEFELMKNWRLAAFYSNVRRDGNVITEGDDVDEEVQGFTSILTSGFHRTKSEIEDEKKIRYEALGGRLGLEKRQYSLHLNVLQSQFSAPFNRNVQPYNQFLFGGDELLNASLDYGISFGQLHFFGESALSDNGAIAHVLGLKAGLSKQVKWVASYRHYPRDYHTIQPNSFGESRNANNEIGFYNGLEYSINREFQLSGYFDIWKNPWLRFNVDAPTDGKEYLFKFRYYKKRKLEAYAQFRFEEKAVASSKRLNFTGIDLRRRNQLRCHLNYNINKALLWRSRVEYNHIRFEDRVSNGFLIYQDFIYKPILSALSFTSRYAFFKTDDYDSRIYTYENHLLFNYSIPAFADTGHRFYINLRYRPISPLTLELRFDRTIFTDRQTIGSGTQLRDGNSVSQVAVQIQYVLE